jgi:hypothetical protein
MALVLNYSSDSLIGNLSYHIRQKEVAVAFDAFNTLLLHVRETVLRLDQRIAAICEGTIEVDSIPLLLSDIWSVIDNTHRIFLLYPLINCRYSPQADTMRIQIKGFRDSYQHFNERISDHFQQHHIGESVLGDCAWQYRKHAGSEVTQYLCTGGMTRGQVDLDEQGLFFTDNAAALGVFDLTITYLERVVLDKKKKTFSHRRYVINIGNVLKILNDDINLIETTYRPVYDSAIANAPDGQKHGMGLPPFILTIGTALK